MAVYSSPLVSIWVPLTVSSLCEIKHFIALSAMRFRPICRPKVKQGSTAVNVTVHFLCFFPEKLEETRQCIIDKPQA